MQHGAVAAGHGPVQADELDLTVDQGVGGPRPGHVPVGRRGQLRALRRQLVWCDHALRTAQRETATAMRDGELSEAERWDAVRRLRALAWKICREVLPLIGRVPLGLQAEPEFIECQRVTHALRRRTEEALRDNANYTVDLVAAESLVGRAPFA